MRFGRRPREEAPATLGEVVLEALSRELFKYTGPFCVGFDWCLLAHRGTV